VNRHTLLLHVKKNLLPARVLDTLLGEDLTVVTEPGHLQQYPSQVRVLEVDNAQDAVAVRSAATVASARRPLDAVVCPFELAAPAAGFLRTSLGLPGIGFETATLFCDKHLMRRRTLEAGVPAPSNLLAWSVDQVRDAGERLGWPVVIKPAIGGGTIGVAVLHGPDEVDRAPGVVDGGLASPVVVESHVPVTAEYHCDGVVWDGAVVFAAVSRYLRPLLDCPPEWNGSWVLPDDDPTAVTLREWHARTVQALGLRAGVTHMEFLEGPHGLLAGEIACRPSGGAVPAAVERQFGVDLWRAFLDTAFQRPPSVRPRRRPKIVVNYHLPVAPGRITALSSASTLAQQPEVVAVDMQRAVGDVVPDVYNSSYASGTVLLEIDDPARIEPVLRGLQGRYVFEVESVSPRSGARVPVPQPVGSTS